MNNLSQQNLKIIYLDEDLIAVDKPSGLLTIQDGYHPELPNLKTILRGKYGEVYTVHRLDKLTSGIVLFARNTEMHRDLSIQFSEHQVGKTYHAIVHGFPIWKRKVINQPLKINGDRKHRTIISHSHGKEATTIVNCIRKSECYSYLEIKPKTGITHQIRSHLSALGFPILGDRLYNHSSCIKKGSSDPCGSFYLHAKSISFYHSRTNNFLDLDIDLPDYFDSFINDHFKKY